MDADYVPLDGMAGALSRPLAQIISKRKSLGLHGRVPKVDPVLIERVNTLRDQGLSGLAIARELRLTDGTVAGILRRHGRHVEDDTERTINAQHAAEVSAGRQRQLAMKRNGVWLPPVSLKRLHRAKPRPKLPPLSSEIAARGETERNWSFLEPEPEPEPMSLRTDGAGGFAGLAAPSSATIQPTSYRSCLWTDGERGAWICCSAAAVPDGPFCPIHRVFGTRSRCSQVA
jgi:hypothetical protein